VPDYLTSVQEGAFYGWPYSYFGQHVDHRVQPPGPTSVAKAIAPDYALGTHVAPLGLVFYRGALLPARYAGGAFIGEHGSWNRRPRSGYKVVFVAFNGGRPVGSPEDVLTGFVDAEGNALGRPVGVRGGSCGRAAGRGRRRQRRLARDARRGDALIPPVSECFRAGADSAR
jgi:glucose/arabinose dehydrogenase